MTELDDLLGIEKSTGGRPCLYRRFLDTMPDDDRQSIERAMANPDISSRHIWQTLRDHRNVRFSLSVIYWHRSGACRTCSTNS